MTSSNVTYDMEKRQSTKYRAATVFAAIVAVAFAIAFIVVLVLYLVNSNDTTSSNPMATTTMSSNTSATTMAPPGSQLRLPNYALPLNYTVVLKIRIPPPSVKKTNPADWNTFEGLVTIDMMATQDTSVITLNSKGLNYSGMPIVKFASRATNVVKMVETYELEMMEFHFDRMLYVGEKIEMVFNYTAYLQDDDSSLYYTQYTEMDNDVMMHKVLAVTQFEPTDARRMMPCFDEPAYKAKFYMQIIHDEFFTGKVKSNMPVMGTQMKSAADSSMKMTRFEQTPEMSTYLLALFIGDFKCRTISSNTTANNGKTPVSVCASPTVYHQTKLSAQVAADVIPFYEDYFNVIYPMKKLDMIALPSFTAGAMENWGMITFRDRYLLFANDTYPSQLKSPLTATVTHEIAHHWFGDLVTMRWWNDLWLNEAFATFMETLSADAVSDPEGAYKEVATRQFLAVQSGMRADQFIGSQPIDNPNVYTRAQINAMFDDITYDKGSSILAQLSNSLIGNLSACNSVDNFKSGITKYLTAPNINHGNADHSDLLYYWQQAYDMNADCTMIENQVDVLTYMSKWINQPGYPLLKAVPNGDILEISQSRFTIKDNTDKSTWNVMLNINMFNGKAVTTESVFLSAEKNLKFQLAPNTVWYTITGGFFRVLYNQNNYGAIINYLTNEMNMSMLEKLMPETARSQLFDDAFTLAIAGKLDYSVVFDLLKYLNRDPYNQMVDDSNIVWTTLAGGLTWVDPGHVAPGGLSFIGRMFQFDEDFKNYMRSNIVEGQTFILNDNLTIQSSQVMVSAQQSLIADLALRTDVSSNYTIMMNDEFNVITSACNTSTSSDPTCNTIVPNLRLPVYCSALWNAVDNDTEMMAFMTLKTFYMKETVNQEKLALLYGMSCARSMDVVNSFVEFTLGTDIEQDQLIYAFRYVPLNPAFTGVAWNALTSKWAQVMKSSLATQGLGNVVVGVTANFNTVEQLKLVTDFMTANSANLGIAENTFTAQVAWIKSNINWMTKYANDVRKLLKN